MDAADDTILELVYLELVGEPMAHGAAAWAAELEQTAAAGPGLRGLECRLEHDGRRLLALLRWDSRADREAFQAAPATRAFTERWAARGARTARSLWARPVQSPPYS